MVCHGENLHIIGPQFMTKVELAKRGMISETLLRRGYHSLPRPEKFVEVQFAHLETVFKESLQLHEFEAAVNQLEALSELVPT